MTAVEHDQERLCERSAVWHPVCGPPGLTPTARSAQSGLDARSPKALECCLMGIQGAAGSQPTCSATDAAPSSSGRLVGLIHEYSQVA
jgi:hypothetical protein